MKFQSIDNPIAFKDEKEENQQVLLFITQLIDTIQLMLNGKR